MSSLFCSQGNKPRHPLNRRIWEVVYVFWKALGATWGLQGGWRTITSQLQCHYQSQVQVAVGGPLTAISGKRFATDPDVKQAIAYHLQKLDTDFFCVRLQVLVSGWVKCWSLVCAICDPCAVHTCMSVQSSRRQKCCLPHCFISCLVQQITEVSIVFFSRVSWCSHYCTNSPSSTKITSTPAGLNGLVGLWQCHLFLWSPLLPSLASYKHLEHLKRSVCTFCSYDRFSSDYCRDSFSNRPRLLIIVSTCPLHSPQSLTASQQIHRHLMNKSETHISEH